MIEVQLSWRFYGHYRERGSDTEVSASPFESLRGKDTHHKNMDQEK